MDKKEKLLGVLAYLGILTFIPFLWKNKSETLRTHANSGIVMLLIWVLATFAFQIPFLGVIIGILLLLAGLVFTVWGIYDAVTGRVANIPVVEKIANALFS